VHIYYLICYFVWAAEYSWDVHIRDLRPRLNLALIFWMFNNPDPLIYPRIHAALKIGVATDASLSPFACASRYVLQRCSRSSGDLIGDRPPWLASSECGESCCTLWSRVSTVDHWRHHGRSLVGTVFDTERISQSNWVDSIAISYNSQLPYTILSLNWHNQ
jgi:hypothetical protein